MIPSALRLALFALAALPASAPAAAAEPVPVRITVEADGPGHTVSPLLHGLFFEDINYGADGGLYAELVQNRSFEHAESLFAWSLVNRGGRGELTLESADPLTAANPHYARLSVRDPGKGFGLANSGFGGIVLGAGQTYHLSVRIRANSPGATVRAVLEDETGRPLAECVLSGIGTAWARHEGTLKSSGSAPHARLVLLAQAPGRLDLDVVSLFPAATFKQRRNGVRADLAQLLLALRPAFLRFPGGCIVEGKDLANRYQWKHTIGDIAERPQNWNRWQNAIRGQTAPQYYQTYGLGFFEYFQLCEDLGCAPVPILNCGMACQYQSKELVPTAQLDPFIQDALDLIEFANGPATSAWGARRAAMGHPAPFHLKFLGIGNEQWGEDYFARYTVFHRTLKARHPEIELITTAGPGVDDGHWKLAWDKFRDGTPADIVDEHYYRPAQWFLENATRYDHQSRRGPRVFAGEFAVREGRLRSTLRTAIAEAAFMTGLVRNSDIVVMSSYAPLLARAGAFQWQPDLIWFDNTRAHGTASYHVQALFSQNRPDLTVPVTVEGPTINLPPLPARDIATFGAPALPPSQPPALPALFAAAGRDTRKGELVLFLVNPWAEPRIAAIEIRGAARLDAEMQTSVLTGASPDDANSFEEPQRLAPREARSPSPAAGRTRTLPAYSLTVLRIPLPR